MYFFYYWFSPHIFSPYKKILGSLITTQYKLVIYAANAKAPVVASAAPPILDAICHVPFS